MKEGSDKLSILVGNVTNAQNAYDAAVKAKNSAEEAKNDAETKAKEAYDAYNKAKDFAESAEARRNSIEFYYAMHLDGQVIKNVLSTSTAENKYISNGAGPIIIQGEDGKYYELKQGYFTAPGKENDATNLDNVKKSVELLKKYKQLLVQEGIIGKNDDIKISLVAMLEAEVSANTNQGVQQLDKSHLFLRHFDSCHDLSENLANGWSDPYVGWYTKEKEKYVNACNNETKYPGLKDMDADEIQTTYPELYFDIGHYLNIVDPNNKYQATGLGINSTMPTIMTSQKFGSGYTGKDVEMSLTEFENQLNTYISILDNAQKEANDKKIAYDAAVAKLNAANTALNNANNDVTKNN